MCKRGKDHESWGEGYKFVERKYDYLNTYIADKSWCVGTVTLADFFLCEQMQVLHFLTDGKFFDKWGGKESSFYKIYH